MKVFPKISQDFTILALEFSHYWGIRVATWISTWISIICGLLSLPIFFLCSILFTLLERLCDKCSEKMMNGYWKGESFETFTDEEEEVSPVDQEEKISLKLREDKIKLEVQLKEVKKEALLQKLRGDEIKEQVEQEWRKKVNALEKQLQKTSYELRSRNSKAKSDWKEKESELKEALGSVHKKALEAMEKRLQKANAEVERLGKEKVEHVEKMEKLEKLEKLEKPKCLEKAIQVDQTAESIEELHKTIIFLQADKTSLYNKLQVKEQTLDLLYRDYSVIQGMYGVVLQEARHNRATIRSLEQKTFRDKWAYHRQWNHKNQLYHQLEEQKSLVEKLGKQLAQKAAVDDKQCLICLDEMEITQCVPCRRLFHSDCLTPWLKVNSICPACDQRMVDPNEFPELGSS